MRIFYIYGKQHSEVKFRQSVLYVIGIFLVPPPATNTIHNDLYLFFSFTFDYELYLKHTRKLNLSST